MSFYTTIQGSITYTNLEDLQDSLKKIKECGHLNENFEWISDLGRKFKDKTVDESIFTIRIPYFCYRNLLDSLGDILKQSSNHLVVWTSSDGIFEGGVYEDGNYINYCLKNWGEKKGVILPDEGEGDLGKRSELMAQIEEMFINHFMSQDQT